MNFRNILCSLYGNIYDNIYDLQKINNYEDFYIIFCN